jgi:uncharacterized membrane protein YfcA
MNMNTKKILTATLAGFVIGVFSGLIGVGGGEFRLPILIGIFGLPIHFATATNLIIGILVSLTSFGRRITMMTPDAYHIALYMGLASIVGGYFGAYISNRIREHIVGYILIAFLFLMGLKLIASACFDLNLPHLLLSESVTIITLVVIGFLIGVASGMFGVAGGELRIPTLMFFCALPIKLAGTISSLVALFAQAGGLWKHHQLKHVSKSNCILAIVMGAFSVMGSYLGAALVFGVSERTLELLLGILLILATFGMYHKLKHKTNDIAKTKSRAEIGITPLS